MISCWYLQLANEPIRKQEEGRNIGDTMQRGEPPGHIAGRKKVECGMDVQSILSNTKPFLSQTLSTWVYPKSRCFDSNSITTNYQSLIYAG